MNLGELNLQKMFFNSQLQLNNDWFVSKKSDSSFENILKTKSIENSEVRPADRYKGFNNSTHERDFGVKFEDKRTNFNNRRDVVELKEAIHEKIAQHKLKTEFEQVENTGSDDKLEMLKDLREKIEALEEAIKEEGSLEEKPEVMEQMAALLGISVEALVEQLTQMNEVEVENNSLVEQIVDLLGSEEINVGQFVKSMKELFTDMPIENQKEFENLFKEVKKALDSETAEQLMPLEKAIEDTSSQIIESAPVENIQNVENVQTNDQMMNQEVKTVQAETQQVLEVAESKEVEIVEVKNETTETDQNKSFSQPQKQMATTEVKAVVQKVSYEEQVNLMKAESTMISSADKVQPKANLSRSIMNQVVQGTKMSINLSDQGSEILIKLNPKNLGNVALKMAFDKGVLMAEIQVENQTVKGVIENNLDELRSALKEEGYSIGDLDVSVNKENTGQEQGQQGFAQQFKKHVKHETFEEFEERMKNDNVVNDQEVDYLA